MDFTISAQNLVTVLAALTALVTAIATLATVLKNTAKINLIHTNTNSTLDKLNMTISSLQVNQATPQEIAARPSPPPLPLPGTPSGPGH